ncbi:MAG TPA: glycosyltransferase family 4 protein [Longimicrobiaceae bacterium]|nr:glycosyltransferase family 4 protein [Longimicrobiaceae bacterium]
MLPELLLVPAAAATSWALTAAVRKYALARSVLDVPNQRSSHTVPTPRGGGMAIVVAFLAGVALAGLAGWVAPWVSAALLGGGVLVAGIGLVDDHRSVSARARLAVHFLAAAWALYWLGGLPSLGVGSGTVQLGIAGTLLAALGVVWFVNMYNFMDGIDGIAGSEAVTVGLAGGGLLLAAGSPGLATLSFLLAAAAAGFLVWNWQPARIFMGDVGSGFLGFCFAVLALASERAGAVPLLAWVLLLGVFLFDATLTLGRRVLQGERWYDAHRSHAYQRAVQHGWGAAAVTCGVIALNIVLGALAWLAVVEPGWLPPALLAGVVVLGAAYLLVERARPMYPTREGVPGPKSERCSTPRS